MPVKKKPAGERFAIAAKITPVHELTTFFSMLIYGRSGTGKTALSSTFPKPMLLLDINEKGTDTIAKVPGIDVLRVDDWDELEQIYWYLKSDQSKYKTVVIDQITQMQDLAMAIVRAEGNRDTDDLLTRKDWGQISGKMKTWLFNFRDLIEKDMYVVFVAHERTTDGNDQIEDQIDPTIGARLMPSLASAVNGAVSAIGNTFIREEYTGQGTNKERAVHYCLRIGPHAYYTTKIRRPIDFVAPEFVVNPTFDKIQSIIKGEKPAPRRKAK